MMIMMMIILLLIIIIIIIISFSLVKNVLELLKLSYQQLF